MLQQKVFSSGAQSIRLRNGARVCIGARRCPPADCQLRCVVGYLPHTCWRLLRHGRLTTMLSGEKKRESGECLKTCTWHGSHLRS